MTDTAEMALLQHIWGTSHDTEVEGKLGEVQTQTLVVFGTADKVVLPATGRTYRERMPNCHSVLVYGAGHAAAVERPEALTNTIIDSLDLRETFIVSRRDGRINPEGALTSQPCRVRLSPRRRPEIPEYLWRI